MGRPMTVTSLGKRLLPAVVAITLLLPLLFAGTAPAADLSVSSKTYGLLYERERAGGQKDRYAPLYEYLSADVGNLGGKPLFFRFSGWGRVDLGEDSGASVSLFPPANSRSKYRRYVLEERERSAAWAVPANRRGRSRVMATTAGSSLFPRGITVVGRPIRTPKTVF